MTSKEKAKVEIRKLVKRFDEHYSQYKDSKYIETRTRIDFIDPFFRALGWDVDNRGSMAEAYREVIHEDKVKISGQLKSPDYSFRFNGKRYFFVEAKKPSVNIKDDSDPAYQVKRYAWNAKLKISIVTDFEEFAVYDCTYKPKVSDRVTQARIHYFTYKDYLEKFEYIWDTFSKEAVENGSHDKYIQSDSKKGSTSVDEEFLVSLDSWRVLLAKDIYKQNSKLNGDELNFLVQHTIDRIIFLRIAEDRKVENYGSIQNCAKLKNSYKALFKFFENADEKYNSGLFDFKKDQLSSKINISDDCLSEIISELYFPKCSYEFSVIPVEILGSAYEQFLGKTIQITDGGKIKIEEKPEVRKAGGVFYTPQYIVEYIVKHTVGKAIDGKTPNQIEKIKILDPSSGSGSFLLGAYQFLLDYHLSWYRNNVKNSSKGKKDAPLNPDGSLKTEIKKKILINNIFGVDCDANAVEVTKLSLLLKCLEGETQASINAQLSLFHERVLPTLDGNIKCGNSLVDTDFYEIESNSEILRKIKPFNWKTKFPDIFKQGGFDVIIGNPPYVFTRENLSETLKDYFESTYEVDYYKANLYQFFIERSFSIKNKNSLFGFILPINWLTLETYIHLRKFLINNSKSLTIIAAKDKIFKNASVDTCLLFDAASGQNILNYGLLKNGKVSELKQYDKKIFNEKSNYIINPETSENHAEVLGLLLKIEKTSQNLVKVANVKNGVQAYTVGEAIPKQTKTMKENRVYHSRKKHDVDWVKYVDGVDVKRYKLDWSGQYIKYGKNLSRARTSDLFEGERILVRQIPGKLPYAIYAAPAVSRTINDNNSMIVKSTNKAYLNLFILAILNSKLISFWFSLKMGKLQRKIFPQFKVNELRIFPVVNISFFNKLEKQAHDKIVSYVEQLLELSKTVNSDADRINYVETQIDRLVYFLYGLNEDDIKIVEGAVDGNK